MTGFFSDKEIKSTPRTSGRSYSCASCGMYKNVRSPRMKPYGNFGRRILTVGEGPGEVEDARGKQWQGKTGSRLQRELKRLGVNLFEDCLSVNAVNCRPIGPKGNRAPNSFEISCCREQVVSPTVESQQPHVIMLFGASAVESIIGQSWRRDLGPISKWRGWTIPDQSLKAWVCPTFHPSYIDREEHRDEVLTVWRRDLERALSTVDREVPSYSDRPDSVVILEGDDEIVPVLERIIRGEEGTLCAFDYETTGLKPQAEGHGIVCTSVATQRQPYAFMGPRSEAVKKAWKRFLRTNRIYKSAHNIKFEDIWSKVILDADVNNWIWDSMLAAHILDNRPGITSLKFQTYVNFGIAGYDDAIGPYLKGKDPKNANSINKIDEGLKRLGEREILTYCGLDSMFCRLLAVKQMSLLKTNLVELESRQP